MDGHIRKHLESIGLTEDEAMDRWRQTGPREQGEQLLRCAKKGDKGLDEKTLVGLPLEEVLRHLSSETAGELLWGLKLLK